MTNAKIREILEAVQNLPIEEQEALLEALQKRLREAKSLSKENVNQSD